MNDCVVDILPLPSAAGCRIAAEASHRESPGATGLDAPGSRIIDNSQLPIVNLFSCSCGATISDGKSEPYWCDSCATEVINPCNADPRTDQPIDIHIIGDRLVDRAIEALTDLTIWWDEHRDQLDPAQERDWKRRLDEFRFCVTRGTKPRDTALPMRPADEARDAWLREIDNSQLTIGNSRRSAR